MHRVRAHRDHLRANVGVVDPFSQARIGHLMDLTPGGLGVSGRGAEPAAELDRVRLALPVRVHERRSLELGVIRRWLQYQEGGRWHAGFRIVRVADADLEILEQLMTWYADP